MKILVIIVIMIGLSAIVGSVIVGKLVFDGKVVESPYETGLRYDEIEALRSQLIFDIENRNLSMGENELLFTLKDKNGRPITDPQITLIISRPSSFVYDRVYPVYLIENGKYRTRVLFPLHGYWDIKLSSRYNWKPVILEKRVYIEEDKK